MAVILVIVGMCLLILPHCVFCDKKKDTKTCPGSNYAQLSDTCYYFYYDTKSWWDAQNFCEHNGGTLLIFQEKKEIKLVKKEIKKIAKNLQDTAQFWLGLKHNAEDDQFYWADGSDLTKKRWENKLDSKVTTPGNCVVIQAGENSGAGARKWETQSCDNQLPYVCEINLSTSRWTVWSKWTDCTVSCGRGNRQRSRKCLQPTAASTPCNGATTDIGSCNAGSCPVATWTKWSDWGECSVSCGTGTESRTRTCSGSGCPGQARAIRKCSKQDCPVATWTKWSDWGECSVTCGSGTESRTRTCSGNGCPGQAESTRECTKQDCPVWGDWSKWGDCSVSCGNGLKERSRRCLNSINKKDCKGNNKQTTQCSLTPCPVTQWSEWSDWTPCSVTCGQGKTSRTRTCLNSENKNYCEGKAENTKSCMQSKCPDSWTSWSEWSKCSVTCGNGKTTRTRKCLSTKCEGKDLVTKKCSNNKCSDKRKRKKIRNRKISAKRTRNKGIVGYEIERTVTDRVIKCAIYCLRYETCRSFNYQYSKKPKKNKLAKEDRTCILNSVSFTDEPSAMETMPGYKLYDMGEFFETDP